MEDKTMNEENKLDEFYDVGRFSFEDYIKNYLEACGITIKIKNAKNSFIRKYDCALVYDNQEFMINELSSMRQFSGSITNENGKLLQLLEMNDNCISFISKDASDTPTKYLIKWDRIKLDSETAQVLSGCENSIFLGVRIKSNKNYTFGVLQSHKRAAMIYLIMNYNYVAIPIGINIKRFSLEEYLKLLKSKLMELVTLDEEDEKWIDAMLADPRVHRDIQYHLNSIPRTFEEAEKMNDDKRDKIIADATRKAEQEHQEYDKFLKEWQEGLQNFDEEWIIPSTTDTSSEKPKTYQK